jgi:hypothetical protein
LTVATGGTGLFGNSNVTFDGSTLAVTGSSLKVFNGTSSVTNRGSLYDTLTLQSSCNVYSGGIASLYFGNATAAAALARIYAIDQALSGSYLSSLIFQTVPTAATTFSNSFTSTGAIQTFTVPAGVTSINVQMWGAGGGGGLGVSVVGGAGAYITGILAVTGGQVLSLIVGGPGTFSTPTATPFGAGGAASANGNVGSGGGRSAIQFSPAGITLTAATSSGTAITYTASGAYGLSNGSLVTVTGFTTTTFNISGSLSVISGTQFSIASSLAAATATGTGLVYQELVNAAGGGGGGGTFGNRSTGGYGGILTGGPGVIIAGEAGVGGGGTQSAGGAGGVNANTAAAGSLFTGASAASSGTAGGGGGLYGGGAGAQISGGYGAAGGGGSSYISNAAFTYSASSAQSTGQAAPFTGTNYIAGVSTGGNSNASGGGGLIVITNAPGGSMVEAMRISSNGFLGVGTAAPAYTLDVTGTSRITSNLGVGVAPIATAGSINVANGFYVNGVALSGGTTISGSTTAGNVLLATGTSTGIQGNTNLFFNTTSNFLGVQTTTPATALDVGGGVTIRNGYRPLYSNVVTTTLNVAANSYGTHYNITTSSWAAISLPTIVWANDSNAYWVFRNNTGTYLNIAFTYTSAGTTAPTNPVTIPPANSVTMMLTYPGGGTTSNYVLF